MGQQAQVVALPMGEQGAVEQLRLGQA